MDKVFSKDHTNLVKGIATCFLLWHHLFLADNGIFSEITIILAQLGKVCVTLFLILSGYGLSESFKKNQYGAKDFYKRHLIKLYTTYWTIWVIFVPIGVIFWGRSFTYVYGSNIYLKLLINIGGLQHFFGFEGYNATWWFMSLIIMLYLMFPFLYRLSKKYPLATVGMGILVIMISDSIMGAYNFITIYSIYSIPFVIGIISSQKELFLRIANYRVHNKYIKLIVYMFALISIILIRMYNTVLYRTQIDTFLAYIIILISIEYISNIKYLNKFLILIGVHSFNIFLIHTFIYGYYFADFIYSFKIPALIFMMLLLACLLVSVLTEKFKSMLRMVWYSILNNKNRNVT